MVGKNPVQEISSLVLVLGDSSLVQESRSLVLVQGNSCSNSTQPATRKQSRYLKVFRKIWRKF